MGVIKGTPDAPSKAQVSSSILSPKFGTQGSGAATPYENISLGDKIANIEHANIMPFLLNFNQSLLSKSIVITTKEQGNHYML